MTHILSTLLSLLILIQPSVAWVDGPYRSEFQYDSQSVSASFNPLTYAGSASYSEASHRESAEQFQHSKLVIDYADKVTVHAMGALGLDVVIGNRDRRSNIKFGELSLSGTRNTHKVEHSATSASVSASPTSVSGTYNHESGAEQTQTITRGGIAFVNTDASIDKAHLTSADITQDAASAVSVGSVERHELSVDNWKWGYKSPLNVISDTVALYQAAEGAMGAVQGMVAQWDRNQTKEDVRERVRNLGGNSQQARETANAYEAALDRGDAHAAQDILLDLEAARVTQNTMQNAPLSEEKSPTERKTITRKTHTTVKELLKLRAALSTLKSMEGDARSALQSLAESTFDGAPRDALESSIISRIEKQSALREQVVARLTSVLGAIASLKTAAPDVYNKVVQTAAFVGTVIDFGSYIAAGYAGGKTGAGVGAAIGLALSAPTGCAASPVTVSGSANVGFVIGAAGGILMRSAADAMASETLQGIARAALDGAESLGGEALRANLRLAGGTLLELAGGVAACKSLSKAGRVAPKALEMRKAPGVAHVSRELADSDKLLRGSHGNAGFIPAEIAGQLEGKSYNSFDAFRGDVWKAVANSKYASEFGVKNVERMKEGLSPFAIKSQHLGLRKTYNLHHQEPIHAGGSVYDFSNLMITTPRFHLEALERTVHYGVRG